MLAVVPSSIWVVQMRKGKTSTITLTAGDAMKNTSIESILRSKIDYKDFQAIKTSSNYKEKLRSNLFAMIRQLGTPTFFITFSCAERLWSPLKRALEALNPEK